MADEELIEELCSAVADIRDWAEKRINHIIKRRSVLLAKGEVIEDAEYVEQVLANHAATITCCDRWFKKNGVED